jgi:hypothetical protein
MNRTAVWLATVGIGAALLGAGLLRSHREKDMPGEVSKPENLASEVLVQLRQQGSNLGKPHSMDFYLYFPTRAAADAAAGDLRTHGFAVTVDRAAAGKTWLCLATRRLVPDERLLDQWGQWFRHVILSHRGEYDGWESSVER